MTKNLVAYFSRTGEQYGVGNITKGNTKILAEILAKVVDADLFEIKVVNDNYPDGYNNLVQYAKTEKQSNARPEIIGKVENFEQYENIYIGYPNWWGDMPMPVYTFIESYDFSGKTVKHVCTHEGSGGIKRGDLAVYGHIAQNNPEEAEKLIRDWLKS